MHVPLAGAVVAILQRMLTGSRPIVVAVLLTVVISAALIAVNPVRDVLNAAIHGNVTEMRHKLDDLGGWAVLVMLGLGLLHVLIPFPAELPNAAAGFAFGFWVGVPVMLGVWVVSGLAAYWLARLAGRPALTRVLGEKRITEAEHFVNSGGAIGLIAVRLIPIVPFSFASFAAGLALAPVRRYTWTTAVGFLPLTASLVLIGSRLRSPNYGDPLLWGPLVGSFALLLVVEVARRSWGKPNVEPAEAGEPDVSPVDGE